MNKRRKQFYDLLASYYSLGGDMFALVGIAKRAAYEVGYRDPSKWLWLFKHPDANKALREHGYELEQSMMDGSFSMRRTYDEEEGGQGKGVEEEIS